MMKPNVFLWMVVASFFAGYYSMTIIHRTNKTPNINKVYQATLMAMIMGALMGLTNEDWRVTGGFTLGSLALIWVIRNQIGIKEHDYVLGMIEHHQMAIDMTNLTKPKLKDPNIRKLAEDILRTQQEEIDAMWEFLETGKEN